MSNYGEKGEEILEQLHQEEADDEKLIRRIKTDEEKVRQSTGLVDAPVTDTEDAQEP